LEIYEYYTEDSMGYFQRTKGIIIVKTITIAITITIIKTKTNSMCKPACSSS
jgi:hypothetical protein